MDSEKAKTELGRFDRWMQGKGPTHALDKEKAKPTLKWRDLPALRDEIDRKMKLIFGQSEEGEES